ncbi:hypothetical protein L6452_05142 [Arctium lappa]|uniref:Uncharacterized protein n=1 Tax=Arctium lappa TaxID=4217 RepID=A0ACB9EFX0_ARCLA|nr:hypothetical protein L6452_05142 [Arctium lappa]
MTRDCDMVTVAVSISRMVYREWGVFGDNALGQSRRAKSRGVYRRWGLDRDNAPATMLWAKSRGNTSAMRGNAMVVVLGCAGPFGCHLLECIKVYRLFGWNLIGAMGLPY